MHKQRSVTARAAWQHGGRGQEQNKPAHAVVENVRKLDMHFARVTSRRCQCKLQRRKLEVHAGLLVAHIDKWIP